MGLESFTYITSLNASNPVHATDPVSQGDDHLRGLKLTLLNQFPNLDAAVDLTPTEMNYLDGVTGVTGTGNLVLSADPTFTGTLTADVVEATSYDGIAAADLLDRGVNENISGEWAFGNMFAGSIEGIDGSDLVDKSAVEEITGVWQFPSIDIGHISDTTITRSAAGMIEVEGRPIISHNDGALGSGEIYVSTSAPSGGSDGDIWLEREA